MVSRTYKIESSFFQNRPQRINLRYKNRVWNARNYRKNWIKWKKNYNIFHSVSTQLHNDFIEILSEKNNKLTQFMNLFWQQQKELFSYNPKRMRYHPMIIRFFLSLASKSKSAYEELSNSNILVLPSSRTLRDYKNAIAPQTGFRKQIIDDLIKLTRY